MTNKDADAKSGNTQLDDSQGEGENATDDVQISTSKEQPEPSTQRDAKSDGEVGGLAGDQAGTVRDSVEDIEEAILYAKKYLEDLLSFFGLNTDVYATTEDHEVIELNVPSTHLNGFLIGARGETMRALQYTVSNALKNQNYLHTRVNVDIADYKKHHADRLVEKATTWFKEVQESGKSKELPPMSPAERRVVHKAASDYGLQTESVGEGRDRHIVLKPGEEPTSDAE